MKKMFKTILLASALIVSANTFALPNKVTVDIQTDNAFKNTNILFVTSVGQEEVGVHYSGQLLASKKIVNTLDEEKVYVLAYVTGPSSDISGMYITNDFYRFDGNSHIGLSFPMMFHKI